MGSFVTLPDGLGSAYVARPAAGSGQGVLVLHAWWGLNPTFTAVCDRLAKAGFLAVAPDLFGDRVIAATPAEAEARLDAADGPAFRARAVAGLDLLRGDPGRTSGSVGALGFSLGASSALSLSQTQAGIAAVVTFYGSRDGDYSKSRAAYLGHFVPGDEWEPDADVNALEAIIQDSGREVTFHRYPGTRHWFFEPDRPEFDADAASLAWDRTVAFFASRLGPGRSEGGG
jgi:carboxymethylenebutenolidase